MGFLEFEKPSHKKKIRKIHRQNWKDKRKKGSISKKVKFQHAASVFD